MSDTRGRTQKKSLGQVFLHDQNILRKIVQLGKSPKNNLETNPENNPEHNPETTLVEIGCGNGSLSVHLAKMGKSAEFHIIEIDPNWITVVQERLTELGHHHVRYHLHDVLTFDFDQIPGTLRIVANIPYYISAKIIKKLITIKSRIQSATLMVQKEFAQKCCAKPGTKAYTSLTCFVNAHFEVKKAFDVSRNCFYPVPDVDSGILELTPKPVDPTLTDEFFLMIKSGFWARRKPLASCLIKNPYKPYPKAIQSLAFFQQHPGIRAEAVSLEAFKQLFQDIQKAQR